MKYPEKLALAKAYLEARKAAAHGFTKKYKPVLGFPPVPCGDEGSAESCGGRKMIHCPQCGRLSVGVLDSRVSNDTVRRRRICPHKHRWTTYEVGEKVKNKNSVLKETLLQVMTKALEKVLAEE